jgi:tRNA A37 threonylcarbamoyladenosine synthetase subunit TsaC/SUA5/YrdC
LPAALTGGELAPGAIPTVGLRVPAHDAPRALAKALGPLPTTSANRSGEPELRDAAAIEAELGGALDLILDGGPSLGGPASTVVDATGDEVRILRPGAITADAIARCLGSAGLPGVGR